MSDLSYYSTNTVKTEDIGQIVDDIIRIHYDKRRGYERRWYDNNFFDDGPPILFETMVFGGKHDRYQERCSTWDEAVAQHDRIVEMALPWDVRLVRALTRRRD